jgi:hypothetical protein
MGDIAVGQSKFVVVRDGSGRLLTVQEYTLVADDPAIGSVDYNAERTAYVLRGNGEGSVGLTATGGGDEAGVNGGATFAVDPAPPLAVSLSDELPTT